MRATSFVTMTALGIILNFTPCSPVFSAEQDFAGNISITGETSNVNGNKAKSHEYSDDRTGKVLGDVNASYDSPGFFLGFSAQDPGYDTQHYRLEGGSYGILRGWFDYNEIIHNVTSNARSFYNGVGSGVLTGPPSADFTTWLSTFDYYTKRKKFSTGVDLKLLNPFFFNVEFSNEKKEGIKPTGTQGTFAGANRFVELPEPIDYRTNTINLEGGYARNPFFVSFSYLYSDFSNRRSDLNFETDTAAGSGGRNFSLAPDSRMNRFALKSNIKLPMNSSFNVNLSDARTTSETSSFASFSGKVNTKNYDLTFTTNPLRFLEGKVYYKYYDRDNKSFSGEIVNVFDSTVPFETFVTNPIAYTKYTFGGDLGLRLPAKFHLSAGYKNVRTHRSFVDEIDPGSINLSDVLPYNTDNIYNVDLKWSGVDFMSAWIGYERLARSADYRTTQSRDLIFRNFSYAAQDRDTFKTGIDLFPTDDLNLSFEYNYKRSDYNDTLFGVKGDTSNAISFSGDYAFKKLLRFSTYFDAEKAILDQLATTSAATKSPQWKSTLEEITYGYGAKAEIYAIPKKLAFTLQGDYLRNHGTNDFDFYGSTAQFLTAFQLPAGGSGLPVNVPNVDSYQKYSLSFVTTYNWSEKIMIRAGYIYDRYKYSDAQINGLPYVVTTTGYSTGAYASPSYSVNTVFLALAYRF